MSRYRTVITTWALLLLTCLVHDLIKNSAHFKPPQVGLACNFGNHKKEKQLYMPAKTCLPLEEHARSILTPYAFNIMQHEVMLSMQYAITEMANSTYLVRHYKKMEAECLVIWIPEDEQVHCSCKEFEHSGILCRHSIRVLVSKNYFQVPEKYFPLRWRPESSLAPLDDSVIQSSGNKYSQVFHALSGSLYSESFISKQRFNYVNRELKQILEHVQKMPTVDEVAASSAPISVSEL